ncbi:GNAT family N-acetyltransferase [Polyangium aurulentum]|uniref:GNAT family N-acetyltransferase n=1 Tax=Polyangium aurulentum TaxID=2567896 RepID=UPI0010AE8C3A|nr:GNAT family N-acetyltransferase [Polyangium aurulentum]UQA59805.1 GNAT family N-acetyltransferase [Polyangium aurulentum]
MNPFDVSTGRPEDAPALAALFLAARRTAMPWLPELHDEDDVRGYMAAHVLAKTTVLVARRNGSVLGFLGLSGNEVQHLYIRPDAQRAGIGGALIAEAKARSPEGLELWVFERNEAGRAFYVRHGFFELYRTDGSHNEEREPDVRLAWRAT